MFLRKFNNGLIAALTMSGGGDGGGGGGGGDAAVAPVVHTFSSDKPFLEQLPEQYRSDPNFKDIKNFDGLVSRYINANKMIGADKATLLQLPTGDDPKEWDPVWGKLGRPEAPDKYVIGKRADGSDYGDTDKAFQAKILPALFEAGLSQKQLDKVRPAWDAMMTEAAGAGTKAAEAYATVQLDGLKKEWGAAYGDNLSDAQAAVAHFGGDALVNELNIVKDGKATGDNAELLKVFAKLGKTLREDGITGRGGNNSSGAMAPGEAQAAIKAKMGDDKFVAAWRNKEAPGHAEAVTDMAKLYGFAYPTPQE
jgi:hypothetical protein